MTNPNPHLHVFLCHASEDRLAVREFFKRIKNEDWIDPWLDVMNLVPGQDWKFEIRQSLAKADSVIIFISNNSINKEGFVQREINYAWDLSLEKPSNMIFLIPIRLEGCDVPDKLMERQWANYFGQEKEETYLSILKSLKLRYGQKLKFVSEEKAAKEREKSGKESYKHYYPDEFIERNLDVYYRQTEISIILEELIVRQSHEYIINGYSIALLERGLRKATEIVTKELYRMATKIDTMKEIASVATNSSGDEEIGSLIADVMDKVGKDGVIIVEESKSVWNEVEYVEGMQFRQGYLSPYFVTDKDRFEAVIHDAYILLCDRKISAATDIVPLLEKLFHSGKRDIVIIAEDIDGEALATLVLNKMHNTINVLAVKAPGSDKYRNAMLQDIAILTGATLISEETGRKLETTTISDLGSAEKVVSDKESTAIIGGKGDKLIINNRIKEIRADIENNTNDYNREILQERLAKLSGGAGIIRVGAINETELQEKKLRVTEALSAALIAVKEGVVPGRGVAFLHTIEALDKYETKLQYEKLGIFIIRNILDAPIRKIAIGAGLDDTIVLKNILNLSKSKKILG